MVELAITMMVFDPVLFVFLRAAAQTKVKAEIIKRLYANLRSGLYDADEINLKVAHIYTAGVDEGPQCYTRARGRPGWATWAISRMSASVTGDSTR